MTDICFAEIQSEWQQCCCLICQICPPKESTETFLFVCLFVCLFGNRSSPLTWTLASCLENNPLIEGLGHGLTRGRLGQGAFWACFKTFTFEYLVAGSWTQAMTIEGKHLYELQHTIR